MSRRLVIIAVVVLTLAAGALAGWRMTQPKAPLAQALTMAPADVGRALWTDWDAVRRELGADLDADPSPEEGPEVDYVLSDLTSGPVLFATC